MVNDENEHIVKLTFIQQIVKNTSAIIEDVIAGPQRVLNKELEVGKNRMTRFRYEFLGTMFAGMAMTKTFGSYINNVLGMFGVFDLISAFMTSILVPVLGVLLPLFFYPLMSWLLKLEAPIKFLLGFLVLAWSLIGSIGAAIGMLVLALASFSSLFLGGTGLFYIIAAGGILVGLLMIIGGSLTVISTIVYGMWYYWNDIVKLAKEFANIVPNAQNYLLGALGSSTKVPTFGSGGIVTGPTLAMIGESGPEAIVPLSGGRGMMNPTININANIASNIDVYLLARKIFDELQVLQGTAYGR